MSNFDVNQVLAQMRTVKVESDIAPEPLRTDRPDFSVLLQESINAVNETQQHAADLSKAFQAGQENVELPEVMIALQKANISFEAMTQVRNKLLTAYQEIMNMQV